MTPARKTTAAARRGYRLRRPRAGDLGFVVHRHGVLYAREFGWDVRFEGVVAEIVAAFARGHDPARERCWIADRDGEFLGCVFLVRRSKTVAQLRLLLVEPDARGMGLGARLVDECIAFARRAGYRRMMLWTHSVLVAARNIYVSRGFRLKKAERYRAFGRREYLVSEIWEMKL